MTARRCEDCRHAKAVDGIVKVPGVDPRQWRIRHDGDVRVRCARGSWVDSKGGEKTIRIGSLHESRLNREAVECREYDSMDDEPEPVGAYSCLTEASSE